MLLRLVCLLAALVAAGPAFAANWSRAITSHFIIYSNQPTEQLRSYAAKLEAFDQAVRFARGVPDPMPSHANKVTIYAVEDLAAIRRIYGGYGVGGFYIPRAGDALAFVPLDTDPATRVDITAEAVFFHEYAHHLMYQSLNAAMPFWLSEGWAEFFSTAKVEADGSVSLGAPVTHRADILLAKLSAPLPLEIMLGGSYKQLKHYYLEEIYGRGWLLTHYLTFKPERKGQLERYLAGIQQGKPAMQSAREAFGDLHRLENELKSYVRSTRFPYVTVPASKFKVGTITVEPLSAGENAMMEVMMQSRRGVTTDEARKLVVEARRIAANYPADAAVQAALAEAETDAEYYDQAIAAADRALAANPRSIEALLQKGRALVTKAEKDKSFKPDWKAVQQLYLAVNRIDPENPRALIGYYETFDAAGLAPTASAVDGLLYAFELAPHDGGLRWMVMSELVAQKRGPEAARVLRPFAFAPHGGKRAEKAQSVMEKIEAGDLAGASKRIEEIDKEDEEEAEKDKKKKKKG